MQWGSRPGPHTKSMNALKRLLCVLWELWLLAAIERGCRRKPAQAHPRGVVAEARGAFQPRNGGSSQG